jgi:hypothetical protein
MDATLLTQPAQPALAMPVAVAWTAAVLAGLLVGLAAAVWGTARSRRRMSEELRASREELRSLRDRFEELSAALAAPPSGRDGGEDVGGYLITSLPDTRAAGVPPAGAAAAGTPVDLRRFAVLAAGESLVRLVSLGYGVRRALSPRSRDRVRLEMREEMRRSRRRRRDELREARRYLRSRRPDLREDAA